MTQFHQGRIHRGTTLIYHFIESTGPACWLPQGFPKIKKPLSTMGQGRIRGTTLHYTFLLSVTETAAFST